jgi:DNA polymerase-3 subunit alpha
LPDFDIDFCERRREEVLAHVVGTYGAEHVGAISTFSEIKTKTAIKDVARILLHEDGNPLPFSEVNAITKLIPSGPDEPKGIDEALETIPALRDVAEKDARIAATLRMAKAIKGLYRQAGTHAAGVVIADKPLVETAPLHPAIGRKSSILPQIGLDMGDCEALGLVKFDFLGLSTTTLLRDAELLLESLGEKKPDWARMDLDEPEIINSFAKGDTFGVFQFESVGMRKALQEVKPTRFSDIVAINALFRPGPIKYIQEFARRKAGDIAIVYPSPSELTRPILEETYGIMVYQEQVMRIAQVCAGYSLGGADVLRRAMGKKKPADMEAQRRIFLHGDGKGIPGALALGLSPEEAQRLFDDMEAFAGYGFNKSHAVAYSLLAWRSMWFKVRHPEVFHCALLNAKKDDTEEIGRISQELTTLGIPLLAPDVEMSDAGFRVESKDGRLAIRFGLDGVRNVGDAREFVQAREKLASRDVPALAELAARAFNARQLESLAAAGTFDRWTRNRRQAHEGLLLRKSNPTSFGQSSLLAETSSSWEETLPPALSNIPDWEDRQGRERAVTGTNFGLHPILAHKGLLFAHGVRRLSSWLEHMRRKGLAALRQARLAVMVEDCFIRTSSKNNSRILKIVGNEVSDKYEIIFYEKTHSSNLDHVKAVAESSRKSGEPVVMIVDLSFDPQTGRPHLRGARIETMLDVVMAVPGWFVATKPASLRIPEPPPQRETASRHDARHRLLILTDGGHEEPMEVFPVDRSFLAAIMCMRDVEFRRVTEEEYLTLLNAEPASNQSMAAA